MGKFEQKQAHPPSISERQEHKEDTPHRTLLFASAGKIRLHLAQRHFPPSQSHSQRSGRAGAASGWAWGDEPPPDASPAPTPSHSHPRPCSGTGAAGRGRGLPKGGTHPRSAKQQARGRAGNIIVDDNESGLADPVHRTQGPESRMMGTSLQHIQVKAKNPPKTNLAKPEPDGFCPYSLHLGGAILKTLCSVDLILASAKPLREAAKYQEAKT